jgi:hypothetical protein
MESGRVRQSANAPLLILDRPRSLNHAVRRSRCCVLRMRKRTLTREPAIPKLRSPDPSRSFRNRQRSSGRSWNNTETQPQRPCPPRSFGMTMGATAPPARVTFCFLHCPPSLSMPSSVHVQKAGMWAANHVSPGHSHLDEARNVGGKGGITVICFDRRRGWPRSVSGIELMSLAGLVKQDHFVRICCGGRGNASRRLVKLANVIFMASPPARRCRRRRRQFRPRSGLGIGQCWTFGLLVFGRSPQEDEESHPPRTAQPYHKIKAER